MTQTNSFMPREPGERRQYQCKKCGETFVGIIPDPSAILKKAKNICPKCGSAMTVPFPAMRW